MEEVDDSKTPLLLPQLSLDSAIGDHLGWAQLLQATLVSSAWFFDAQQTFLSVFDDPTTTASSGGLPATSFFAGCLVGGLVLATAADSSLGRKNTLLLSTLAMSLSGLLTTALSAATGDVRTYSLLRFLAGIARSAVGTSALVLSTELVGRRWRGRVGVAGFVFFTLGFLSLPAMAYLKLSLYAWTSVPTLIYSVVVFLFVHESPRWLLVQGRKEEAIATLNKLSCDNSIIDQEILSTVSMDDREWTVKILFNKKWALKRLTAISAVGFGIGLVYYGMPLALGDLGLNLYLTVTLNALSELPASLIAFFLIGKLNRRSSLLFFTSLSGVCSVTLAVLKRRVVFTSMHVGLELVSFFSACAAFDVVLIFAVELFPTSVRNTAVSVARQAMVLGGVFGPPLAAAAGRGGDGFVSYVVFGVVIGCCGLFVVCLPETRGRGICDTMDEEEKKDNCFGIC